MAEQVVRTIYSAHLATSKLLNKPFSVLPNSTLNKKFNLFPDDLPSTNEYPHLGYIGIGNKGASYDVTQSGYVLTTPIPHLARHASLYNFIPFVVRDIYNDLDANERIKYRMRVPITINGNPHVAYYLRVLDLSNVMPTVELRNVNNGVITTTPFEPDLTDLSPTQPNISNTNINNPNGDYLVSSANVTFTLDQTDINNILDACDLIYGDPRYAVINEIALCTGVDAIKQGTFGNILSNYTEVIAAQVAAFISQYHALTPNTTKVEIQINLGSVEPLLI